MTWPDLKNTGSGLMPRPTPGGVPVACVAIGKAGAKNAAYLAAQIVSLTDTGVAEKLAQDRQSSAQSVLQKDLDLQQRD